MQNVQHQTETGRWVDCGDGAEEYLLACETHTNRTRDNVLAELESGKTLRHRGGDWYAKIRFEPAPQPQRAVETVLCDCGHSVERGMSMRASRGTACPDCYDRMSE